MSEFEKQKELEEQRNDEREAERAKMTAALHAKKTQAKERTKQAREKNIGKSKKIKSQIGQFRQIAKTASPVGFFSLMLQIKPMKDWTYGLALFAAIFKDIVDLIEGTIVLYAVVVVVGFCVSIFIGLMMLLANSMEEKKHNRKMTKRWITLFLGTAAEILIGVNFIPMETLTVLLIYAMTLQDRKEAKDLAKRERKQARRFSVEYA